MWCISSGGDASSNGFFFFFLLFFVCDLLLCSRYSVKEAVPTLVLV